MHGGLCFLHNINLERQTRTRKLKQPSACLCCYDFTCSRESISHLCGVIQQCGSSQEVNPISSFFFFFFFPILSFFPHFVSIFFSSLVV